MSETVNLMATNLMYAANVLDGNLDKTITKQNFALMVEYADRVGNPDGDMKKPGDGVITAEDTFRAMGLHAAQVIQEANPHMNIEDLADAIKLREMLEGTAIPVPDDISTLLRAGDGHKLLAETLLQNGDMTTTITTDELWAAAQQFIDDNPDYKMIDEKEPLERKM